VRIRRGKELKGRREVIISVWVSVQTKSVQVGAERDPPSSGSGETYPALAGGLAWTALHNIMYLCIQIH
jgi:hypothetical protein